MPCQVCYSRPSASARGVPLCANGGTVTTRQLIPRAGEADADEAVAHAWQSFEERDAKLADADEAVAHAWQSFEERDAKLADADEAVAHAWQSFKEE